MEGSKSGGGISRVLAKLHASMDNGEFYEAHQMYRTLYFRYFSQKKYHETLELLYDGAISLLDRGQVTSGCDLAQLFASTLSESQTTICENVLLKLEQLFAKLPMEDNCAMERTRFLGNTMQWSKQTATRVDEKKRGHAVVHGKFAVVYWQEKNYAQARMHFMLSEQGEACASFLIEYHLEKGYSGEVDLFVAQAVLQFLCHDKKSTASVVFVHYTQNHPSIEESEPPFVLPLLNFLWLLLLAIDLRKVQYFTVLVEQYEPSIRRDPEYLRYLDKIGQIFFGLPPPHAPRPPQIQGGLIGNLIQSFLTGDSGDDENESGVEVDDDSPSDPQQPPPPTPRTLADDQDLD